MVIVDGRWGYMDKTGREVIPCQYDRADDFHDGMAQVTLGDRLLFIDKTGREVIEVESGKE